MRIAALRADTHGATMAEYLIVIAVVGVAALGTWYAFGGGVDSKVDHQSDRISELSAGSAGAGSSGGTSPIAATPVGGTAAPVAGTDTSSSGTAAALSSSVPTYVVGEGIVGGDRALGADEGGRPWWRSALAFGWATIKGVGLGAWDTVTGLVSLAGAAGRGAWWVVTHPAEAARGVWHAVTHPAETASAAWGFAKAVGSGVWSWLGDAWDTVRHGTAEERGDLLGRGLFEAALTVATGGAGHATKARWLGKVDDAARLADGANDARRAAGVAGRLGAAARRIRADEVDPAVREALEAAMRREGREIASDADFERLLNTPDGIADGAVGQLRREILTDPAHRDEVVDALRRYTPGDDASRMLPDDDLLRAQMYGMAVPERIRPRLINAMRTDLANDSRRLTEHLAENPTRFRRVVVGGGPNGQAFANELHRAGHGRSTLVIDGAFGDANFGQVRRFNLNSTGGRWEAPGNGPQRTVSPAYGSPIQVGDLDSAPYPNAGTYGDTALMGLHQAQRRGTDVLTETRVTRITERADGETFPGDARYRIETTTKTGENVSVYADEVVLATGIGPSRLPTDPATNALMKADRERLARGTSEGLEEARAVTATDLLRAEAQAGDGAAFYRDADTVVFAGGGDSATVAVEDWGRAFPDPATRPRAIWVGANREALWEPRYGAAGRLLDEGALEPWEGRISTVHELPDGRIRVTTDRGQTVDADKAVLAIGVESEVPPIVRDLSPGFNEREGLEIVRSGDEAVGMRVGGGGDNPHDVYVVSPNSGLHHAAGDRVASGEGTPSWLDYYGYKSRRLASEHLARGPPEDSPVAHLRNAPDPD